MSHKCSHYSILALKIEEFEKSELSIRLADKMDKMERTWEWLSIRNFNIKPYLSGVMLYLIWKMEDLVERVNNAHFLVEILVKVLCKVFYALIVGIVAYFLTRDTGDYYAEFDMLPYVQSNMPPPIYYKWAQFLIVWGVLLL